MVTQQQLLYSTRAHAIDRCILEVENLNLDASRCVGKERSTLQGLAGR
jgi:hypothetical protein